MGLRGTSPEQHTCTCIFCKRAVRLQCSKLLPKIDPNPLHRSTFYCLTLVLEYRTCKSPSHPCNLSDPRFTQKKTPPPRVQSEYKYNTTTFMKDELGCPKWADGIPRGWKVDGRHTGIPVVTTAELGIFTKIASHLPISEHFSALTSPPWKIYP